MERRAFLARCGSLLSASWMVSMVGGVRPAIAEKITKIQKSAQEWRTLLTPEQFHILREEGTERPFSSPLNKEKRKGTYACAGCDLPLFTSEMKYDSGTGWPSFFTSIEGHLETKKDSKLFVVRTEYHCARCEGHQGHVFDDGPRPTGQRWCNNGVALKFLAENQAS
ncbi:MAG: peptide-methionine (R)-S-oxide reductase MsrB [Candidatus Tectomicrobia bacterium]|uniref:peptide-methionine (R)-S-oxide reductase n=1 Tax=Tectimicrobiota bacterium TaxID=2528274 RepID=A0A937W298_UNCTE|nr:peptide-methionine (R)-S-oxide reductase MsrB [Candidatus Tectomicrobia bacterium]